MIYYSDSSRNGVRLPDKDTAKLLISGVLEKFRKLGIGGKLMDIAEEIAAAYADTVYLCVGLCNGYGSAQRMYAKRGCIPDGSGVGYKNHPAKVGETYTLDDELILYMSKKTKIVSRLDVRYIIILI